MNSSVLTDRLNKVLEPGGDKDTVSLKMLSTILNDIFAYYSKTFAIKKKQKNIYLAVDLGRAVMTSRGR